MKNADASLADELPYWDFFDEPFAHAVLADGSVVGGCKIRLVDSECHDEASANDLTLGLRTALNSVAEGVTLQFILGVRSDFSDLIEKHIAGKKAEIPALVSRIGEFRERKLRDDMKAGLL